MSNSHGISAGGTVAGANCNAVNDQAAQNNQVLTIDVVAKMFKISRLKLRLLELRGLVRRRRGDGNWVFGWSDCERISLLVKARNAGLTYRDVASVLKAMAEETSSSVVDAGRTKCLSLIRSIEGRQTTLGAVLAELYLIDWELSKQPIAKASDDIAAFAQQG